MTEARELKPCPFCGGEAVLFDRGTVFGVRCTHRDHLVWSYGKTAEDASVVWNTRPAPAEPSASTELREGKHLTYPEAVVINYLGKCVKKSWSPKLGLSEVRTIMGLLAKAALTPPAEATGGWRPPGGWKLVPEKLTEAMMTAGPNAPGNTARGVQSASWDAMLAAAPPPPETAGAGGVK